MTLWNSSRCSAAHLCPHDSQAEEEGHRSEASLSNVVK